MVIPNHSSNNHQRNYVLFIVWSGLHIVHGDRTHPRGDDPTLRRKQTSLDGESPMSENSKSSIEPPEGTTSNSGQEKCKRVNWC